MIKVYLCSLEDKEFTGYVYESSIPQGIRHALNIPDTEFDEEITCFGDYNEKKGPHNVHLEYKGRTVLISVSEVNLDYLELQIYRYIS